MRDTAPRAELLAFGHTLRRIRRDHDLSQQALATRAGVSPKHVSDIERSNKDPRLTTLIRLARALEMDSSELLAAMEGRPPNAGRSAARR